MVPKPIVANSSFVTYKYGKNKLGVEVRNKNAKKDIDSQPIKSKYFPLKPIFGIKYAFAALQDKICSYLFCRLFKGYSCADLYRKGLRRSGTYYLQIQGTRFWYLKVFCDMETDGGGWMVR